jgi:hypothetical protein
MRLFSSPLELGLRTLFVLDASAENFYDLQRLVVYDYLLVHSGDANGPASLHPPTPYRSGELLVKRDLLREGMKLMVGRGLVAAKFSHVGIHFGRSSITSMFLAYCRDEYSMALRVRSAWLTRTFQSWSDAALESFVREHMDEWGGEFTNDSVLRRPEGIFQPTDAPS